MSPLLFTYDPYPDLQEEYSITMTSGISITIWIVTDVFDFLFSLYFLVLQNVDTACVLSMFVCTCICGIS